MDMKPSIIFTNEGGGGGDNCGAFILILLKREHPVRTWNYCIKINCKIKIFSLKAKADITKFHCFYIRKPFLPAQNMLIAPGPVYLVPVVGGIFFTFAPALPYLQFSARAVHLIR